MSSSYTTAAVAIIITLLIIASLIMLTGFLYHRRLKGSDAANYLSLMLYTLSFLDFTSDLFFFGQLCLSDHSSASQLALWSALFLFTPHITSTLLCVIFIARTIHHKPLTSHKLLIALSTTSSLWAAIELLHCGLFHLDIFNLQLRTRHTHHQRLVTLFLVIHVLLGAVPMMMIAMMVPPSTFC